MRVIIKCSCGRIFKTKAEVNDHARLSGPGHEGVIIFVADEPK